MHHFLTKLYELWSHLCCMSFGRSGPHPSTDWLLSVILIDRWWGSTRGLSSSDWVTYCVEDPEDQVVPDYPNLLCSSVSADFKTVVFGVCIANISKQLSCHFWRCVSENVYNTKETKLKTQTHESITFSRHLSSDETLSLFSLGLLFYLPLLDVCHKVDIRLTMLKVPPHTVQNNKTQLTYSPLVSCEGKKNYLPFLKWQTSTTIFNPTLNWSCVHRCAGGDEGLGEAGAERSVLLPDRERGFVQHRSFQSDLSAADAGPGSCPRHSRPAHFQSHPAAQEEDRTDDTSICWLCCWPLGHQGGESRHVRLVVIHLFFRINIPQVHLFQLVSNYSQD